MLQNENSLYIKNLCASYGNSPVLKNVSLELKQGEFSCLCGPNGCGKSTLLSVLAGVYEPKLHIFAADQTLPLIKSPAEKMPRKKAAQFIAYMQQNEYSTWNLSVKELVLQGRFCHTKNGFYTEGDINLALEALSLLKIDNLGDRPVHSLSGGEFQKARIARALCQQPAFLLLDEPAANLDFVYEPWLMKTLQELAHSRNIGILISIHDVNLASNYADSLTLLPLLQPPVCGKIEEVLNLENLRKTYGMEFECQKINYFQSLL